MGPLFMGGRLAFLRALSTRGSRFRAYHFLSHQNARRGTHSSEFPPHGEVIHCGVSAGGGGTRNIGGKARLLGKQGRKRGFLACLAGLRACILKIHARIFILRARAEK